MRRRTLARPWILLVLGLLAIVGFACSDDDLDSATTTTSPSGSNTLFPSVVPTPTASVPSDWLTYTDPNGRFTVRHPPDWLPLVDEISSVDPSTVTDGSVESILVELNVTPDDGGGGCGVLQYDITTGELSPEPGATAVELGGVPAWKIVRGEEGDRKPMAPNTRIEAVSGIYNGYCFNVAGYFTQQDPDVNIFSQITGTFQFTF